MTRLIAPYPFNLLSWEARLRFIWDRPCMAAFEFLAKNFPGDLAMLIEEERLDSADLTFAAEAMKYCPPELARRVLFPLLSSRSAIVREGAIYGLSAQRRGDFELTFRLKEIKNSDPRLGVRWAAADALEELEDVP